MAKVGRLVKESMIDELSHELSQRPNFFVTTVNRLPAPATDAFRQKLFGSQARLIMVKRRLGRRAFEHLNVAGLADLLEGSAGLVLISGDALQAAKLIIEFRKAHEEQVLVRGGFIDGQLLDKSRVEQLASLPPRPVLLAQVVATIESPIADVIFTLERLIGDVAWAVEQAAMTRPAESTPQAQPEAASDGGTAAPSTPTPPSEQAPQS